MVEDVESIRTELKIQRFTLVHLLRHREIGVCIMRSVELVARRITEVRLGVIGNKVRGREARRRYCTWTAVAGNVRADEVHQNATQVRAGCVCRRRRAVVDRERLSAAVKALTLDAPAAQHLIRDGLLEVKRHLVDEVQHKAIADIVV
jgi:hypothetical protein